jgi:hypothetical protein
MRRKIAAVLSTLAAFGGFSVVTTTPAQAAVRG